jgi:hypothetical protein
VSTNPFDALGLPTRPDLTDEQVRAAWRAIATATHPDRADGGDVARYTAATAAYVTMRTPQAPARPTPTWRPPRMTPLRRWPCAWPLWPKTARCLMNRSSGRGS